MVRKRSVKKTPLVSINIRTFNSEKYIEETLRSARRQTYSKVEIVVSDGYSTDKTVEILKEYNSRIYFADKLGDARQQNLKRSKGRYILSLDSDQIISKTLIKKCVDLCERDGYDALIIAESSIIEKGTYLEKLIAYDKSIIDKSRDVNDVFGTVSPRFFRKEILDKLKWPKKLAIFDDAILYTSLVEKGAKVGYLAKPLTKHHEVESWEVLFKKFFRYGQGYIRAFKAKPATVSMHSLPRRSYFSRFALSNPKYFLGLLFLYLFKVIAASLGATFFVLKSISPVEKNRAS